MSRYAFVIAATLLPWNQPADAQPIDPIPLPSERCEVLADELAVSDSDYRMLVTFCEALGIEEGRNNLASAGDNEMPDYFVKCEVAGDPEWIGFRLVTRSQCEEAQGTVRR